MNRDGALLILIRLAAETAEQLAKFEAAPHLRRHSPMTINRLENLALAVQMAIEDVHKANEAELAR